MIKKTKAKYIVEIDLEDIWAMATELFYSGATEGIEFYLQLSHDDSFKWPRFINPLAKPLTRRPFFFLLPFFSWGFFFFLESLVSSAN